MAKTVPVKLFLIVAALSLSGSFHFGFLVIVPNVAVEATKSFLNDSFAARFDTSTTTEHFLFIWPLFLNLTTIGSLLGSLLLKPLAEKLGRLKCFYSMVSLQIVGSLISASSYFGESWELLWLGRLLSGVAVGISLGLQPMFFSEISPTNVVGFMNGMTGTFLELGFMIGSLVALPAAFGTPDRWHYIFWIETLLNLPALCVLPFIFDSPKYILAKSRNYSLTRKALIFYQHQDVEADVREIEEELNSEKHTLTLAAIFRKPYLKLGLLIGILTIIGAQCSGIGAISFYSTILFTHAGVSLSAAPYATVAVTLCTFVAALASSLVVDRVGRRPLVLISFVTLVACIVLFMIFTYISYQTDDLWPGYICIAIFLLFSLTFGMGPAVVMWSATSELMPQNARSTAVAFVQVVQWIFSGLANGLFYPLQGAVGVWAFMIFVFPLSAISVFLYFKFPETKNKTTLEIITILGYRVEDSLASENEETKIRLIPTQTQKNQID